MLLGNHKSEFNESTTKMKHFVWRIRWCLSEIQTTLIWCVWGGGYMYVLSSNYAYLVRVWGRLSGVCVRRRIYVRAVFKLRLYSEILSLEFRMPQIISRQWWGTHAVFRCTINIMPLYLIVDIYTSLCLTSFAKKKLKSLRHTQNKWGIRKTKPFTKVRS